MKVYHYDSKTGAYRGATDAKPDPLEYAKLCASERTSQQAAKDLKEPDMRNRTPLTNAEFVSPTPSRFLIPALATTAPPPSASDGHGVFFEGGAWTLKPLEDA